MFLRDRTTISRRARPPHYRSLCRKLPSPSVRRSGTGIQGRVVAIEDRYALVELVPGAKGIAGLAAASRPVG